MELFLHSYMLSSCAQGQLSLLIYLFPVCGNCTWSDLVDHSYLFSEQKAFTCLLQYECYKYGRYCNKYCVRNLRDCHGLIAPLPPFLFFHDSWDNLNDVDMCMQLFAQHTETQICMLFHQDKIHNEDFWFWILNIF